ncbi:Hypothetical protein RY67_1822 [Bifidobacterium longum subsp. infantis]|uniref:Uncharacterized protein n=1 Tax=Bifidobacterium longum subsp. infantis TaxID=1682 RepID=A0A0M4LSK1_BIFLI|nr:Hypothetical protein RY67_1822 [Bifidobacterium longum subsp. infantis]BAJ68632.1 hypothetical protein BLIJ_1044 [Bifidobacterium longum subsp. infantis ATCC 15697 = JCM 1222 = DSM 20088]
MTANGRLVEFNRILPDTFGVVEIDRPESSTNTAAPSPDHSCR